jgi:hypothetical protein
MTTQLRLSGSRRCSKIFPFSGRVLLPRRKSKRAL